MLTAKKIKCRPRSVGQRNWAAQFERWLGYPLHRDARRAISAPPPEKDPSSPGPRPTSPTLSDPSEIPSPVRTSLCDVKGVLGKKEPVRPVRPCLTRPPGINHGKENIEILENLPVNGRPLTRVGYLPHSGYSFFLTAHIMRYRKRHLILQFIHSIPNLSHLTKRSYICTTSKRSESLEWVKNQ